MTSPLNFHAITLTSKYGLVLTLSLLSSHLSTLILILITLLMFNLNIYHYSISINYSLYAQSQYILLRCLHPLLSHSSS